LLKVLTLLKTFEIIQDLDETALLNRGAILEAIKHIEAHGSDRPERRWALVQDLQIKRNRENCRRWKRKGQTSKPEQTK
jgi:hypothetical protein